MGRLVLESDELKADWVGMLAHQLQVLPPIESVLGRLGAVLSWLDAPAPAPSVPSLPPTGRLGSITTQGTRVAPPSVAYWGTAPIEQIRFAGANRLLVSFTYNGKHRLAEPYSLRRAAAGHVTLFAWVLGDGHIKQFRVDEIRGLTIANETFSPRYAIELTGSMIPSTPRRESTRRSSRRRLSTGLTYVFRCTVCWREFGHERNNAILRPHQDDSGFACVGRRGFLDRVD